MDLAITILPVVTKDLPISPRFTPYNFLSRCKFSTLTTRQPMVELPLGNSFKCHEEVLSLQPMIPPKRFDIFPPDWGMLRRS